MIETTIPKVQHPSTRESRGIALYRDHADEITFSEGVWLVPSQHDAASVYEVTIGRRGDACECSDFTEPRRGRRPGDPCKHIVAATICRAKSATCAGCGERVMRRDLVEVQESLTYFEGDLLCPGCRCDSDADVL